MDPLEEDLRAAEDALRSLAEGPAQDAARQLERAFSDAGRSIETSLSQAARAGELDFSKMARSILADLARIAAETAIAGLRQSQGGGGLTVNFSGAPGADAGGTSLSRADISKAVAKAAIIGRRYG